MTRSQIGIDRIADAVVRIPRRMRAAGGISAYDLAARSGYFEHHDGVGEQAISQRLRALPDLVDEWLAYSEDKRVGTGWFFRSTSGRYEVGYYGGASGEHSSSVHEDRFDACAMFIKREMEAIRVSPSPSSVHFES